MVIKPRVSYFRCPYCSLPDGGHGQRISKLTGEFKVKKLYDNVLILQCKKCKKTCRMQTVGKVLEWSDMSAEEKKVFKKEIFINYNGGEI